MEQVMKKRVFFGQCLALTFIFTHAHLYFRSKFTGTDRLEARIEHLEKELSQAEFRTELARFQVSEYRQHMASLIPEALNGEKDPTRRYQLRTLASAVAEPDGDKLIVERAAGLFEKGKRRFRDGEYESANEVFQKLIDAFPESVHVPEAHFLLAEGLYQVKEYEGCIETIEAMITLFPESELTGYALLRLGKVYEGQDRFEDAVEMYRTVLATYTDQALLMQARLNMKAVDL
jgi:TolA-binding protein